MKRKLNITLLSHNLSSNSFGRTFLLAQLIKRFANVRIIGLELKDKGLWYPLRGIENDVIKIHFKKRTQFLTIINQIRNNIKSDLILSVKPYIYSYGVGLYTKFTKGIPVILDIDDWEWGFLKQPDPIKNDGKISHYIDLVKNFINCGMFEKLSPFADYITVSNQFLQKKFGGAIISHYRDTDTLHPSVDGSFLKKDWNLPQTKKIIMFFGTNRAHKGIEDLIRAYNLLNTKKAVLVIVGVDLSNEVDLSLKNRNRNSENQIFFIPRQPFETLPFILSIADIIAIPQRRTIGSVGQTPAKLFDAMAMGKPIISTNVSDIPDILAGECGIIVEQSNVDSIASAIDSLLSDPEYCNQLGKNARKKAEEKYSYSVGEKKMKKIIYNVVDEY